MKQEEMIRAIKDWGKNRLEKNSSYVEKEFLKKTGDASKVTNIFSRYEARIPPESGENLDITLGKILRYLTDIKTVAFDPSYKKLNDRPVEFIFGTDINAVSEAEQIDLCYLEGSNIWGHIDRYLASRPMLIYGSGGATTAEKTGTTDFMRCYLSFYRVGNSATGVGSGWGTIQLGSAGSTARWSLTATVTTATSFKQSLVLKIPKGSWARVYIMSLPC